MFTAAVMGCVWQLVIKENDNDDDDDDDDDGGSVWLHVKFTDLNQLPKICEAHQ